MRVVLAAERIRRAALPGGLRLLAVERPGSGMVAVHLLLQAGAMFDGRQAGTARFVARTLERGTRRRSGQQLAEELEGLGATLTVTAALEVVAVVGRALTEDAAAFLGLLAEVVTRPAFPSVEVEKVRGELLTEVRIHALDTWHAAERAFRQLAFPPGHPHAAPPDGEEAVLQALGVADLTAFHARHYRPDRAVLALVGDLPWPRVQEEVARAFEGWEATSEAVDPVIPPVGLPEGVRRREVPLPGKSQSDIVLGGVGPARTDPAYYPAMMATVLLGQLGMMGRVGERVRERMGLAYHASMELRAGRLPAPWWVRAGVNPANVERAIGAILEEVARFQQDGPAPDELADARDYLTGSLAVRLETHGGVAAVLAEIEYYGLGLDYLERFPGIVRGLTAEEIRAAAEAFPLDRYVLAVAGPER
jgi:zinc protease